MSMGLASIPLRQSRRLRSEQDSSWRHFAFHRPYQYTTIIHIGAADFGASGFGHDMAVHSVR